MLWLPHDIKVRIMNSRALVLSDVHNRLKSERFWRFGPFQELLKITRTRSRRIFLGKLYETLSKTLNIEISVYFRVFPYRIAKCIVGFSFLLITFADCNDKWLVSGVGAVADAIIRSQHWRDWFIASENIWKSYYFTFRSSLEPVHVEKLISWKRKKQIPNGR